MLRERLTCMGEKILKAYSNILLGCIFSSISKGPKELEEDER